MLLTKIREKLREKPVSPDGLRFLINTFYEKEYISASSNIDEIFNEGTRYKLWDYWNYEAIVIVVRVFAADDLKLKLLMETYRKDLESFKVASKLIDYIAALSLTQEEGEDVKIAARHDRRYYKKLEMKLNMRITNHSLKYIDELWNEFANLYSLPEHGVLLDRIHKGCVSIVWLIPSRLVSHILDAAPLSYVFYHKHNITRMELDGRCIYPEPHELHTHKERDKGWQYIIPLVAEPQGNLGKYFCI